MDYLNIAFRCISTSLVSLLDNGRSSKNHENTSNSERMLLYSTPSFVTDMDLISTRSIWLHPCTVLETTGKSGGLLLHIGLVLKWFSLLFSHFWIRLILMPVFEPLDSRLYLSRTFTFIRMIKE